MKNIVDIEHIQKTSNVKIEEVKIDNNTSVTKEIKVYTEDDHFANVSDEVKRLYEILKERVLQLDDIDVEVKKMYIAFKGTTNIIDIAFKKNEIRIYINMKKGTLEDPLNITGDISSVGHWGNGDYWVMINSEKDIDNVIHLIKQSLLINKKYI